MLYLEDYLIDEHHPWGLWHSVTGSVTPKLMYVNVTYISWSTDFALYLKDYLMECHILDNEIVWHKLWPQNKYNMTYISWSSDFA